MVKKSFLEAIRNSPPERLAKIEYQFCDDKCDKNHKVIRKYYHKKDGN